MQKRITTVTRIIKLTIREYYKLSAIIFKNILNEQIPRKMQITNINTRRNKTSE